MRYVDLKYKLAYGKLARRRRRHEIRFAHPDKFEWDADDGVGMIWEDDAGEGPPGETVPTEPFD